MNHGTALAEIKMREVRMIEVRFHGRGGQGGKVASRILGRAGFLAGLYAQDFSLFGAERRGAPVVACTRLSREPIDRRGYVEAPDIVVVLDDSLLQEARQQVLQGVRPGTTVFINTAAADVTIDETDKLHAAHFVPIDLTAIARRVMGGNIFLSAVAAGTAAKCVPAISRELLAQAVRVEVKEFGLKEELVVKNAEAALDAHAATPVPSVLAEPQDEGLVAASLDMPRVLPVLQFNGPTIRHPASADLRDTGSWRMERPEIELGKCKRCFLCYLYCPEAAIRLDGEAYPHIDYDHCKGCMICYQECPTDAITRRVEV
jgi:pyruvate ferredoxin oxidoreductase gamma subunit